MTTLTITRRVALTELVRDHQVDVWRYLRVLGCQPQEADDLTQETFLAVMRRPFEIRTEPSTRAYLRTVARNLFLMSVRSGRQSMPVADIDAVDRAWDRAAGDDGAQARVDALRVCLDELDGRARKAIDMRYRDGASRSKMAAELVLGEEGVKTLLRRTREVLGRCIERRIR